MLQVWEQDFGNQEPRFITQPFITWGSNQEAGQPSTFRLPKQIRSSVIYYYLVFISQGLA